MVVLINDKELTLHFGIAFLRELDKKRYYEQNGARVGAGLELIGVELLGGSYVALSEIIQAALCTESNKPTAADVDRYLESLDEKGIDKLLDEVISTLKKSPMCAKKITVMEKVIKEAQA